MTKWQTQGAAGGGNYCSSTPSGNTGGNAGSQPPAEFTTGGNGGGSRSDASRGQNARASVGAIISAAMAAAEKAKGANHIHIAWTALKVIVTTHIDGVDAAWIEMDSEQLDELIRLAKLARSGMTGSKPD
jgi:hypothetical protein